MVIDPHEDSNPCALMLLLSCITALDSELGSRPSDFFCLVVGSARSKAG
jgi:hypothetical protein